MAEVGDFVGDDQMMLGIDRGLDVIADDAGAAAVLVAIERASPDQSARLAPSGGDALQLLSNALQVLHVRLDCGDLLLEPRNSAFRDEGRFPVRAVKLS